MTVLIQHIRESQVEAYISQGWECVLLQGWHGMMRRFMAILKERGE